MQACSQQVGTTALASPAPQASPISQPPVTPPRASVLKLCLCEGSGSSRRFHADLRFLGFSFVSFLPLSLSVFLGLSLLICEMRQLDQAHGSAPPSGPGHLDISLSLLPSGPTVAQFPTQALTSQVPGARCMPRCVPRWGVI